MPPKFLSVDKEARFPNLTRGEYEVTSEETPDYNCIAHAAGKTDNWWWPDDPPAYWPDGHDKAETLEAFVKVCDRWLRSRRKSQLRIGGWD
jgi:hypothetical protein